MNRKIILFFLFFIFLNAKMNNNFYKYDLYYKKAAERFNVPFLLLKAISLTENYAFNPNIKIKNKNNTYDYGLMQINSLWLKKLSLKEEHLLNPKINIFVAAYILRKIINKHGYNWNSIGLYHSSTKKFKLRWIKKVKENIKYIMNNSYYNIIVIDN